MGSKRKTPIDGICECGCQQPFQRIKTGHQKYLNGHSPYGHYTARRLQEEAMLPSAIYVVPVQGNCPKCQGMLAREHNLDCGLGRPIPQQRCLLCGWVAFLQEPELAETGR